MKLSQNWPLVATVAVSLVGSGLATALLGHNTPRAPKVVTTEELHIVDDEGRTRITLGMVKGRPSVRLLDADGNLRISLYSSSDQHHKKLIAESAGLGIIAKNGETRVALGLEYTCPMMKMYYQGGDSLLAVGVLGGGLPAMVLREKDKDSADGFRVVFQAPHRESQP